MTTESEQLVPATQTTKRFTAMYNDTWETILEEACRLSQRDNMAMITVTCKLSDADRIVECAGLQMTRSVSVYRVFRMPQSPHSNLATLNIYFERALTKGS